ncbi:MAG: hypothetical protein ACPGU5_05970 [Lishizhenia sp.]
MKVVAQIISIIFLPLLMPVYGLLITFYSFSIQKSAFMLDNLFENPNKTSFLYLFIIFCFLAPALSLLMLKFNNSVSSLELNDRSERKTPITITAIYYFILYFFLIYQDEGLVPKVLLATSLAGGLSSLFALLINVKTKISLHALGTGSLLGFILAYFETQTFFNFNFIYLIIGVGLLTTWARLYLEKHNLKQIGLGYLVGLLTQIITIAIYYKLNIT